MATTDRNRLTLEDLKVMTEDDIIAFWRQRQLDDRAAGRDHYTVLIDAATSVVVCAID